MPRDLVPSQQRDIETTGFYEEATSAAIEQIASPGMNVLECGANCGFHTVTLARAVSPDGKVYAYEANPELIPIIRKNLASAGLGELVEVHQEGVWRFDGVMPFPIRNQSLGGASLKHKSRNPYRRWRSERKVKRYIDLDVRTLESMCRDRSIGLIRLDVEGAEYEAVQGSVEFLRSTDIPIVLEWIPRRSNRRITLSFHKLLVALGYRVYRIGVDGLRPVLTAGAFYKDHAELWTAGQRDVLCTKTEPESIAGMPAR